MGVWKVLRVMAAGVAGMVLPGLAIAQAGGQGTGQVAGGQAGGQGQGGDQVPTIQVNSRLVFLDVTVLDKKGRPVTEGLGKDDFRITEEKRPQRIFSFEAPERHVSREEGGEGGEPPVTIFVLDQLNSTFEQMAYIRYKADQYLKAQPERLAAPAEVLLLGNKSLEMVQGFTRDREEVRAAIQHLPGALPWKLMNGAFWADRFEQSLEALEEIALENTGVPGRKNIVWIGHGGPSLYTVDLPPQAIDEVNEYVHETTNMLVDARMSLFVIYPWLSAQGTTMTMSEMAAGEDVGDSDPFAGDVNFGVFVNATGGKLFYNRNDVDKEMGTAVAMGSEYYTLTYQPPMGDTDGRFKRIRVSVDRPGLRVVTKVGYYAPNSRAKVPPQQQAAMKLWEAARATIPFSGLVLAVRAAGEHPDTGTVDFKVTVSPQNVSWQPGEAGKSVTSLELMAVTLGGDRKILTSKAEDLEMQTATQDPLRLAHAVTKLPLTLRVPKKAKSVRFVVQDVETGRLGAVELDTRMLKGLPVSPTPEPTLQARPGAEQ